jgi:hypothetical protein
VSKAIVYDRAAADASMREWYRLRRGPVMRTFVPRRPRHGDWALRAWCRRRLDLAGMVEYLANGGRDREARLEQLHLAAQQFAVAVERLCGAPPPSPAQGRPGG